MASSFEILGFLPSLVAELNYQQMQIVAKEARNGLQFLFHTDKGGDEFRSNLINTAFLSLKSETSFTDSKKEYVTNGCS